MSVYKTKEFARFARKVKLTAQALTNAAAEVADGKFDADLGGGVFKQRIAREGGGKSGGFRTLLVYKKDKHTFFVYGFAKNQQANISVKELSALKRLAEEMLSFSDAHIAKAEAAGELIEVVQEDGNEENGD